MAYCNDRYDSSLGILTKKFVTLIKVRHQGLSLALNFERVVGDDADEDELSVRRVSQKFVNVAVFRRLLDRWKTRIRVWNASQGSPSGVLSLNEAAHELQASVLFTTCL